MKRDWRSGPQYVRTYGEGFNIELDDKTKLIKFESDLVTPTKVNQCFNMVDEIIDSLDEKAMKELLSGSGADIDSIFEDMVKETYRVLFGESKSRIQESSMQYLNKLTDNMNEVLMIEDFIYFITCMFEDVIVANHHMEWAELERTTNRLSILASRDHGKSFFWSVLYPIWKMWRYNPKSKKLDLRMSREGFLFAHTADKAEDYLKIIKSFIEGNDILKDKLYNKNEWVKQSITTKNGVHIKARGFMSSVRGFHPTWIVCDDVLTDNVIYSEGQRDKAIDYFYSVIMNMIVPKGKVIVVGTPFHKKDLYSTFRDREKLKIWKYREYPCIFPNGQVLWEDRYGYDDLLIKRKDNGPLIFSREFLCRPIASDSSIFPAHILAKATPPDMKNYTLVNTVDAHPMSKEFQFVVTGCDFSISSGVGADYTVFTTWGIDNDFNMWLLNIHRQKGMTYGQQVHQIKTINHNFRPDVVVMENNNFQHIYTQSFPDTDIPIVPHTTGTNKNDLKNGLPGLAIAFEQGKILLPTGDEYSKKMADIFKSEFGSISFIDGKGLQAVDGHDDVPMSTWQAKVGIDMARKYSFNFDFVGGI